MSKSAPGLCISLFFLFALPILTASSLVSRASAQQGSAAKSVLTEEQSLIEKIKTEILKELREGDFLQQQIDLGIQNYIKRQEESQAAARAEEARLANERVKNVRRVSARDHIYGNPDAPVSLIEYSDFECPFCKQFHSTAMEIVDAYAGKVNWVYRHFPLVMHNPGAQKQAEASECVRQLGSNDAFWKFTNAIYHRTLSNGNGFPLTQLAPLGREIGVNDKQLQECIDSGKYAARVQEDFDEGSQIGVTGTPASILIHNVTGEVILKVGAQPMDGFKPDIDKLLDKKAP
jgi:protein-disulfide isomerase